MRRDGARGWAPAPTGEGGNRALALAVGGGGCRFEYGLARLEAGRSRGQLPDLDANDLVVAVEVRAKATENYRDRGDAIGCGGLRSMPARGLADER